MVQQGGVVVRTIASEQEGWRFKSLCLCGVRVWFTVCPASLTITARIDYDPELAL